LKKVCGIENYDIYGIMDGHGSEGHLVSDFVKNQIKEYFNNKKIYAINNKNKEFSFNKFGMSFEIYDKLKHNNYELIKNFYENTNKKLSDTEFDINFSGTTCIMVFKIGKKIICSNVGDSRAILVERKLIFEEKTNSILNKYEIIELSHDHKPNNKGEKERIEKCGGEVAQEFLNEEDEKSDLPFRVWKEGCNYPGLAISRSLGDKIAEKIGVISEPEFIEAEINKNSKYIIMGSDGVFEYLTNNDILEISNKYLNNDNLQKACKIIVEKAATIFRQKENRVDDITIKYYKYLNIEFNFVNKFAFFKSIRSFITDLYLLYKIA
jgi:serine/threonine protein phosphatase PrpC